MSTLDRICELLNAQGKKQKELTDYLGISKNSFTDWKSGRVKSYTKHLGKIAEFLNVSADYLLGNEKSSTNNGGADTDTYSVVAMGGIPGTHTISVDNNQLEKLNELLKAARDLPPEKIDKLIKMTEII